MRPLPTSGFAHQRKRNLYQKLRTLQPMRAISNRLKGNHEGLSTRYTHAKVRNAAQFERFFSVTPMGFYPVSFSCAFPAFILCAIPAHKNDGRCLMTLSDLLTLCRIG